MYFVKNAFHNLLLSIGLLCLSSPLRAESPSLTLSEAYKKALIKSETIGISKEQANSAQARYEEALAALFPQFRSVTNQRFRNDVAFGRNSVAGNDLATSGSSRALSKHPLESTITLSQPIFSGFREYFATKAEKAGVQAARLDQKREEELLYQDVAEVFYQTLYYQEDTKILSTSIKILTDRINELKKFVELGKSRQSEIEAAFADNASLEATHAQSQGLLNASKEMLAFLIGEEASTITSLKQPQESPPPPLQELLNRGELRSDIQANLERASGAHNMVTVAKRERWPNLSLNGTYYAYEDPDINREWEMLLRLDIPLFDGGAIGARIDQSRAQERTALLTAQQTRRVAERDIRIAYSDVLSSKKESLKLKALVDAAQKNYEAQHADYGHGVVTNVDVLNALKTLQDAKRRYLTSRATLQTNIAKLRVATGDI